MKTPLMRSAEQALLDLTKLLPELEALYLDIHSHPELSMQETRTASLAAERLRAAGPLFAPVLHPTLETGVETMVVGALARLSGDDAPVSPGQAAA